MLAGRMHAAILAAGVGTPVVGLAYNQKFRGFLRLIDPASACMEIEDFVAQKRAANLGARLQGLLGLRNLYATSIAALRQQTITYARDMLVANGLK
jgi:polysaccharide pyruvyl transferase WcaK-like protein